MFFEYEPRFTDLRLQLYRLKLEQFGDRSDLSVGELHAFFIKKINAEDIIPEKRVWLSDLCVADARGLGVFEFFLNSKSIADVRTNDGKLWYKEIDGDLVQQLPQGIYLDFPDLLQAYVDRIGIQLNRRLDTSTPVLNEYWSGQWWVSVVVSTSWESRAPYIQFYKVSPSFKSGSGHPKIPILHRILNVIGR